VEDLVNKSFVLSLPLAAALACASSNNKPAQPPAAPAQSKPTPSKPAKPADQFEWIDVADGVAVFRHNAHMNLVLVQDEGVAVVDPLNPKAGAALAKELKARHADKKLLFIAYSHYHADHAGGAQPLLDAFGEVPIYAGKKTGALIAEKKWKSIVPPTDLIDPGWKKKVGELTLEMRSVGPNHSSDMLVGWVEERKLIFVVDFVSSHSVGYRDLPGFWLPEMWESMDKILEWPIEHATFGHGLPGTKQDIVDHREYWRWLRAEVQKGVAAGWSEDEAAANIKLDAYKEKGWRQVDDWGPMNVRGVYRYEVEAAAKASEPAGEGASEG
jgi:glyoxylase-like metal-dependent hydrolase (beta-lactamase superfamily II)